MKATENAAIKNEKEQIFEQKDQQKETLQLLSDARVSYKAQLKKIKKLATSPDLSDSEKVQQIRQLLEDYHQHLEIYPPEPKLDECTKQALDEMNAQNYYQILENLSLKLQNRVADILRNIAFDIPKNQDIPAIFSAIKHYQAKTGSVGKEAPVSFLFENEQAALYSSESKFRGSLYKVLLYFYTADSLKAGVISLKPAYRYLSLENYLHPMVVGCQCLIQNAIVLWNELYLSQKLALLEDEASRKALLTIIRNRSTLIVKVQTGDMSTGPKVLLLLRGYFRKVGAYPVQR